MQKNLGRSATMEESIMGKQMIPVEFTKLLSKSGKGKETVYETISSEYATFRGREMRG